MRQNKALPGPLAARHFILAIKIKRERYVWQPFVSNEKKNIKIVGIERYGTKK